MRFSCQTDLIQIRAGVGDEGGAPLVDVIDVVDIVDTWTLEAVRAILSHPAKQCHYGPFCFESLFNYPVDYQQVRLFY